MRMVEQPIEPLVLRHRLTARLEPITGWQSRWAVNQTVLVAFLLFVALGVGTLLRVWQIGALGYNSDEVVYTGQAAALLGDPTLKPFFPLFRAHPMLYQYFLALVYAVCGIQEVVGRLATAAVGIATILLTFVTARTLYGAVAGAWAALFVALMPYHVIVSRQVLLDAPMTFWATLTLYLLVRFGVTERRAWLWAAGAGIGLTFLTKETGIVLVGSVFAFLALAPSVRVRLRDLLLASGSLFLLMVAYPLAPRLAGADGAKTTGYYFIWQLFRRPNHDWSFYATTLPEAFGPLLLAAVVVGLWLWRHHLSWKETLLLAWIGVPIIFFQLWPVKGFHYLLMVAPPIAILGAQTFTFCPPALVALQVNGGWMRLVGPLVVACSLVWGSWSTIQPVLGAKVLAGAGGAPGGRELGQWVRTHTPKGSIFMTLGPSMANLVQFYGRRKAYGLSVSPNPLHRNPAYEPMLNPDYQLRSGEIHYLVWDAFSAERSPFFAEKLLRFADRYHGRIIHSETIPVMTTDGMFVEKPLMILYEVRP